MENEQTTFLVCDIQFRDAAKVYFFDPGKLEVKTGDEVIIETARGPEFGRCTRGTHSVSAGEVVAPLRPVLRLATEQDKKINADNRLKEKHAYEVCLKKIAECGLEMQLVSTEYAFDGSKILFFFTADGRVDFRELVKSLASVLRTRIELRQIGVRDKAKMVGGLGICGRPFCCREFLDDFQPVSIKMAKTQNLSLNPTKISGTCGRLMCCLNYEQEAYEELLRTSPKAESFVDTPDGRGTVTDVNLLRQTPSSATKIVISASCATARRKRPTSPFPTTSRPSPAAESASLSSSLPSPPISSRSSSAAKCLPHPVRKTAQRTARPSIAAAAAAREGARPPTRPRPPSSPRSKSPATASLAPPRQRMPPSRPVRKDPLQSRRRARSLRTPQSLPPRISPPTERPVRPSGTTIAAATIKSGASPSLRVNKKQSSRLT